MAEMVDVRRRQEHDDQSEADEPRIRGHAEIDRRGFLSASTLALLGIAASIPSFSPGGLLAAVSAFALDAPWRPLSSLSTVSVAADSVAKGYPKLAPGSAFDNSHAVKLLDASLKGLSGGTAVEAVQARVPIGGTVLVKPNWVEPYKWSNGKITHPSLVVAVARIAAEAVGPTGRVLIGEGTSEGKDLPRILSATGFMSALHAFGLDAATATRARVEVIDLNVPSTGSVAVKLGGLSRFASVHDTVYDGSGRSIGKIGNGRVGTYHIAQPVIDADLIIDFAKAKVHTSAGVTLAMKNLLGIVPSGKAPSGKQSLKTVSHYSAADVRGGTKHVLNRTIGRTSADLNAAALYVARDGSLQRSKQRKVLCIIDGVISGQTNQFSPTPKVTGWVAAGYDPVAVDHVATRCMGFDPLKVRSLKPAASGALWIGTGSPGSVRMVYHGPGSFAKYFTAKRALKPESKVATWGTKISLTTRSIKTPTVHVSGSHVVVKPATTGVVVRLHSGSDYRNLARAKNGTFSADIPAEMTGPVRVTLMDAHFNVWTSLVRP